MAQIPVYTNQIALAQRKKELASAPLLSKTALDPAFNYAQIGNTIAKGVEKGAEYLYNKQLKDENARAKQEIAINKIDAKNKDAQFEYDFKNDFLKFQEKINNINSNTGAVYSIDERKNEFNKFKQSWSEKKKEYENENLKEYSNINNLYRANLYSFEEKVSSNIIKMRSEQIQNQTMSRIQNSIDTGNVDETERQINIAINTGVISAERGIAYKNEAIKDATRTRILDFIQNDPDLIADKKANDLKEEFPALDVLELKNYINNAKSVLKEYATSEKNNIIDQQRKTKNNLKEKLISLDFSNNLNGQLSTMLNEINTLKDTKLDTKYYDGDSSYISDDDTIRFKTTILSLQKNLYKKPAKITDTNKAKVNNKITDFLKGDIELEDVLTMASENNYSSEDMQNLIKTTSSMLKTNKKQIGQILMDIDELTYIDGEGNTKKIANKIKDKISDDLINIYTEYPKEPDKFYKKAYETIKSKAIEFQWDNDKKMFFKRTQLPESFSAGWIPPKSIEKQLTDETNKGIIETQINIEEEREKRSKLELDALRNIINSNIWQ